MSKRKSSAPRLWVLERATGFTPRWVKVISFVYPDRLGLDTMKPLFTMDEVSDTRAEDDPAPPTLVNVRAAHSFRKSVVNRHLYKAFFIGEGFMLIHGTNPYDVLPFLAKIREYYTPNNLLTAAWSKIRLSQFAYVKNYQIMRLKSFKNSD